MTPEQYVEDRAAKSGSSFYYAFRFLPPPRRAAITAFYAFCREVDDVVDEVHDSSVAATKLAWWRKEVASALSGAPSHPVMKALLPHTTAYQIEARHLLAVIDRLVDAGNTVVVIEHNLHVIKHADWIIDMGPEGGSKGGRVIFSGTPTQLLSAEGSLTSAYLRSA